jgi:hypothetical protein
MERVQIRLLPKKTATDATITTTIIIIYYLNDNGFKKRFRLAFKKVSMYKQTEASTSSLQAYCECENHFVEVFISLQQD